MLELETIYVGEYCVVRVWPQMHGRRQGGQMGPWPPLDIHTLYLKPSYSKILPFLEVNTGSLLTGPFLKNFLPTPLPRCLRYGQSSI